MRSFEEAKNSYIQAYETGKHDQATHLAWDMIQVYGFDGVKVLLATQYDKSENSDEEYQIYSLNEVPSDCPWKPSLGTNVVKYAQNIFSPLESELKLFITEICQYVKWIFPIYSDTGWHLCYLLYLPERIGKFNTLAKEKLVVLVGGMPNINPKASGMPKDWNIPDELKKLYKVHDGFGQLGVSSLWGQRYFLPSTHLELWTESVNYMPKFDAVIPYPSNKLFEIYLQDNYYLQLYHDASQPQDNTTFGWCIKEQEVCSSNVSFFDFLVKSLKTNILLA